MPKAKLRLGVSACLLGARVRYDGGDARHPRLSGPLARAVEWVPVCPEVELGLGVPRPPLVLRGDPAAPRLVVAATGADLTRRMRRFAAARARALARLGLDGFVLKSRSPSCGLAGVPVYDPRGGAARPGRGLWAAALLARLPTLPVIEETALDDPVARAAFLRRALARARRRGLRATAPRPLRALTPRATPRAPARRPPRRT